MIRKLLLLLLAGSYCYVARACALQDTTNSNTTTWWPEQKSPAKILTARIKRPSDIREMNLAQSISGLAAQALNEGTTEEGVWIGTANPVYQTNYNSLVKRLHAREDGAYNVWDLLDRYRDKGIIKGYILYDLNRADNSINLATVYAGLKKGVLIDVTQEEKAKSRGLAKLYDARASVFDVDTFASLCTQLNPRLLVLANPAFSNNRDYAIAHKSMVCYGTDPLFQSVLKWLKPLSPVIGWNKGDEFSQIAPCTRLGLINIPADWCMNLPLLSVSSEQKGHEPAKVASLDPGTIDWKDDENFHAFVMSDGDNVQWMFGGMLTSPDYWNNPYASAIPMSYTSCVLNLSMAGRDVYDYMLKTQPEHSSVVEYGGGYYYPDLFASATADPERLLRAYAARINVRMQQTGTKVFGFICKDVSGQAAMRAYKIYAEEIDDLTGMIAVQYSPYNGGMGKVFWVKNKKGIGIPVVTAKYQLWANLHKEGSGNPVALAGWINEDRRRSAVTGPQLSWTIVHAWSRFTRSATTGSISDAGKNDAKATRGVSPVEWTREMLDKGTKVVSIEELLWRIRMKHNAAETKKVLAMEDTVINAGISGNNTKNLLARVGPDCLAHHPALTILMVGTNDMNNGKYVPPAQYRRNLDSLVKIIKGSGSKVLLMSILPFYEPYLLTRHPAAFFEPEGPSGRRKAMNGIIREVAGSNHVSFFDIGSIFEKVGKIGLDKDCLIRNEVNSGKTDGVHPTPNGYRFMALAISQYIQYNHLPADRIVCFGDSITRGDGSTDGESYPAWLKKLLQ